MSIADTGPALAARPYLLAGFAAYLSAVAGGLWFVDDLLPDSIVLTIMGHQWTVIDIHHRVIRFVLLSGLAAPAVVMIEAAWVGWQHSSLRHLLVYRSASGFTDLVAFLLWQGRVMPILGTILTLGATLLSGEWLHEQLRTWTGVNLSIVGLPLGLQIATYGIFYTFLDYWNHRLDHSSYFWPLHRYHHSARDFYVLTAVRIHPANFSGVLVMTIPLAIVETPPDAVVGFLVFVGALRYLIHSRIDAKFGWFGRWVVQSPVHHRLHHSLDTSGGTANYGLTPLWDRLFGTWRDTGSQATIIGVSDPYRHGAWIFRDVVRDYVDFVAGLLHIHRRTPAGVA